MRVLFVDPERRVLDGIRRMLMACEPTWETHFATSAEAAAECLDGMVFDAVVTELQFAEGTAEGLLAALRERWPSTLRIVLSGQTAANAAIRALHAAHQFLSKPCAGTALIDAIRAGIRVRARIQAPDVVDVVGRLGVLPAAPRVHAELSRALLDPRCDARRVAAVLSRDPGLAANVLHLANSAFFPAVRPVADVHAAVARVGLANINHLVLVSEVYGAEHGERGAALAAEATRAAAIAAHVAAGHADAGTAVAAALLADVGYLLPGMHELDVDARRPNLHADVGACLLALWQLPTSIVDAVAGHHAPPAHDAASGVAATVHIATSIAAGVSPDGAWIERHGLQSRLAQWTLLASASVDPRT